MQVADVRLVSPVVLVDELVLVLVEVALPLGKVLVDEGVGAVFVADIQLGRLFGLLERK